MQIKNEKVTDVMVSVYNEEFNNGPIANPTNSTEPVEYIEVSETRRPSFDKKSITMSMSLREMKNRVESEPPVKMIWTPIKENSIGLVYVLAKTGKTTICENLGMNIAAGRETFLEEKLNSENKKVLFISLEEFYTGRTNRNVVQLNEFTNEEQDAIMDNYIVVTENVPKVIQSKEDWEVIKELIRSNNPGVVFLDSLTRMVDDQIENSEIAKEAMLRIRALAEEFKITVIVIHHSTKIDYSQPMTQQNVAGSRVVLQETDFIIGINKTIDNQRYIKLVSARYADDNKEHVDLFELNENLHVKITGKAREMQLLAGKTDGRVNPDNRDLIYNYCIQYPDRNITTTELKANFVGNKNIPMTEVTMYASIDKLISAGKLTKIKQGNYKVVF